MKEAIKKGVKILRSWGKGESLPPDTNRGICSNFEEVTGISLYHMGRFSNYPNYSGNILYPLPAPENATCPPHIDVNYWNISNLSNKCQIYYHAMLCDGKLWDRRTKYAKERIKFCLYLADIAEKDLNEGCYG
jgi:hypothetical protein